MTIQSAAYTQHVGACAAHQPGVGHVSQVECGSWPNRPGYLLAAQCLLQQSLGSLGARCIPVPAPLRLAHLRNVSGQLQGPVHGLALIHTVIHQAQCMRLITTHTPGSEYELLQRREHGGMHNSTRHKQRLMERGVGACQPHILPCHAWRSCKQA